MGTSTSSKGGSSGSPFDPAWLEPVVSGSAPAVSPPRRFAEARSQFSGYLKSGDRSALRSATRSLVGRGMGGASRAASAMRGTASAAGFLGQFLTDVRSMAPSVLEFVSRVSSQNLSANDLILEVINEVLPASGSLDEDSARNAAAEALGELYETNPDLDLFNPTDSQIQELMAITIANDLCNRLDLLLGQMYERLKFDPATLQERRNDVRLYVRGEVRIALERANSASTSLVEIAQSALQSVLEVFESK